MESIGSHFHFLKAYSTRVAASVAAKSISEGSERLCFPISLPINTLVNIADIDSMKEEEDYTLLQDHVFLLAQQDGYGTIIYGAYSDFNFAMMAILEESFLPNNTDQQEFYIELAHVDFAMA